MTSARIAEKDITCYKIMWRNKGMHRGKYCSWVRCFKYELGMSYHEQSFCNRIEKNYHGFVDVHYGFHSYIYYQDAHRIMTSLRDLYENKVVVLLKCTIPAGSQYYISQDDIEFCSDKIIIKAQYVKGKWVESFPSVQEK